MNDLQRSIVPLAFAVLSLTLLGASCDKKSKTVPPPNEAAPKTAPADEGPKGVDTSGLNESQKARFSALVDKLASPCGKAHSLRTSLDTDDECKRSVFAGRYVARLVGEDYGDEEVITSYELRYSQKPRQIDVKGAPYDGMPQAPVVLVEYFDYGCPHCRALSPVLDEVLAAYPSEVVLYYKHFPLGGNAQSATAAMAAVAAQEQGKFKRMHNILFANQTRHTDEDLRKYAKEAGLDMKQFEASMADEATRARVLADREQGVALELGGTPTIFINGREYHDEFTVEAISDWIREELGAVSQ